MRNLRQEMLNSVDVAKLLRSYKCSEVAMVFKVTEDYVWKTERLKRIVVEGEGVIEDEMNLGRKGSWKLSKERNLLKQKYGIC